MKKPILILFILFTVFPHNSFGQKNTYGKSHMSCGTNPNFASGVITGLVLNELFSISNNTRKMYFTYNQKKGIWKLKRDNYSSNLFMPHSNKVIARFENPRGGQDFIIKINNRGQWYINAPKRLKKILKHKLRKNL